LLLGDELYYKAVTPLTVSAIGKLDGVMDAVSKTFQKTTAETEDRIASTITTQEIVAGAAVMLSVARR
jgi:hypothetical protein